MLGNPVHQLPAALQVFWAKTGDKDTPDQWMNLPQHMLDSATVAQYLWQNWVSVGSREWVCESLGLSGEEAKALVAWIVGTHDIGKATPEFAGQLDARNNQDLYVYRQRIEDAGYVFPEDLTSVSGRCPHSQYSQTIIEDWLSQEAAGGQITAFASIAQISGAHHGTPAAHNPDTHSADRDKQLLSRVKQEPRYKNWLLAWDGLLSFVADQIGAHSALYKVAGGKGLGPDLQFFLTGLTIMSDWLASNPDFFPYSKATDQQERVLRAFENLAMGNNWEPGNFDGKTPKEIYCSRFGWRDDAVLRPIQEVAVEAARSLRGGGLMCIEAPMGQGKTEAGLVAAEILAQKSGKKGLMFAAPTQATADGLFTRVEQWVEHAAQGSETVSMFLGHSKSALNSRFQEMRFAKIHAFDGEKDGHQQATIIAHRWFSRKTGVLSSFVVGTVDQVLMMSLASRHVMLRHLGLGEKVVIIDEVHAYDAYMNVYLENALEWLGKMRAPVILMSATLPAGARQRLMQAYARGLGVGRRRRRVKRQGSSATGVSAIDLSYPVIHTVSAEGEGSPKKWEVEQPDKHQEFTLQAIDDSFAELDRVLAPLEDGGCAAIVCNTVDRAQSVYEHLQGMYSDTELRLFHSRFIGRDRVSKEEGLREALGKGNDVSRPEKLIVVGTQVIEQSLDIDFDVMVTDHAPVDLVLQRMGRLHRHERDKNTRHRFREPICYVRGIEVLGEQNVVPEFPDAAEFIYDRATLISSYAVLMPFFAGRKLRIPADLSSLVQEAYGEPQLPSEWVESWEKAKEAQILKRQERVKKAEAYSMRPAAGKEHMYDFFEQSKLTSDSEELVAQAKVRDTDETLEVIVVQSDDGGLTYRPLGQDYRGEAFDGDSVEKPNQKLANVLAGSMIRLPYQFADNGKPEKWNPFDQALESLEKNQFASWQKHFLLKGQLPLILDSNFECELAGKRVQYSDEYGLQVFKDLEAL